MMDFIFSMFLVPFFPELEDPHKNHAASFSELEQRLQSGQKQTEADTGIMQQARAQKVASLGTSPTELPAITGRLFEWSSVPGGNQIGGDSAVDLSAESLRLTGLIESAGQRVAILSDGQVDHVVGVGSYVLGAYKVASLGPGQVVLSRIDSKAGEKRLELNLMPANTPEDAQ